MDKCYMCDYFSEDCSVGFSECTNPDITDEELEIVEKQEVNCSYFKDDKYKATQETELKTFGMFFNLSRPIEVITGDYRHEWQDAKIRSFSVRRNDTEGHKYGFEVSLDVDFTDGCSQHMDDIFGWGEKDWRYKQVTK